VEPYVVRQGDYLARLAYQFGFDADAVWADAKNAQLRQDRSDHNILSPTDLLYIPDQGGTPATQSLTTGTTNAFVSNPPTTTVTIRFVDAPFASQAYSVPELPELTGLTTGQDGTATFSIPVTLDTFTIAFTGSGTSFSFDVGCLDPINTLSGIFQRLQNLGYIDPDVTADPPDLDVVRAALRAFRAASQDPTILPSSPPDGDASSQGGPESSDDNSASTSTDSSDASTDSDSSDTSTDSGSDDADASSDDAGLTDEGKLDDKTSTDLVTAHCC
jgi:hypothetical protein